MPTRFLVHAVLATLIVGGFALAADALVVSDEERLDQLVDGLVEGEAGDLLRWVDLSFAPVSLQVPARTVRFEDGDDLAVSDALTDALVAFEASDLSIVQRATVIDGDRATVSVRARAHGELHDATFHLVRGGSSWWIERLVAR